jgi:hypothetical protein
MRTLLSLLWTDQLGSTLSTEMALVTSIAVGALAMGMAEFNTSVNREFQNSARVSGLMEAEETSEEEDTAAKRASGKSRDVGEEIFVLGLVFWRLGQTAKHDVRHGKVDVGATAGDGRLVFAAEQAVAAQPAECPFHDPAVRKYFESLDVVAAFHDFQFPPECLSCCVNQFAGVAAVGPDEFEPCFSSSLLEHQLRSVTVLNTGGGDDHRDQQSQCIDQNMSFTSFDFLAGVVSTFAASLCGFRGLAVHDRC